MSLDVYLYGENSVRPTEDGPLIFIREDGQTRQISREEWDRRFPGREPVTFESREEDSHQLYHANITHNLGKMADVAGLYECLWEPGGRSARDLIEPLAAGLARLRADPTKFREYNPPNGWGSYLGLVEFVEGYLLACHAYPSATVRVWR